MWEELHVGGVIMYVGGATCGRSYVSNVGGVTCGTHH